MKSEMPTPSSHTICKTTRETALALARAAAAFPFLGISDAQQLLDVVRCELSHEEILDDFQRYGNQGNFSSDENSGDRKLHENRENPTKAYFAKAIPPRTILHIMSGNTPHAALQSLIRGLLIGSHNFCKIPSAGLPEVAQFRDLLPSWLANRVEISRELSVEISSVSRANSQTNSQANWLAVSEALIVFGNDETIAHFQKLARPDQRFIAHGNKISAGIVVSDAAFESVSHSARDASLFDQQGCLSPHAFYVVGAAENAREYASRLAKAMADFQAHTPRGAITVSESAAIREVRESFAFRIANGEDAAVFESADSTDWTVIYEADPAWRTSCLNRVVFVKPLPENFRENSDKNLEQIFAPIRRWLSTIALWPATLENTRNFVSLGASRFCSIGEMQSPSFLWHQDGGANLASLVRWIDAQMVLH